jgi:hypothetical protein
MEQSDWNYPSVEKMQVVFMVIMLSYWMSPRMHDRLSERGTKGDKLMLPRSRSSRDLERLSTCAASAKIDQTGASKENGNRRLAQKRGVRRDDLPPKATPDWPIT